MIPITDATKTALHQAVKQVRAQISWATSADTTETITSDGALISLKKEAEGYYCKSTLRKITVKIANTTTNLLDRRITALVQVKTGADTWGDINWGSFTITEAQVDEAKGTSTFVGYGGIALLQAREYNTGELSFPTTVGGLLRQVADKFALKIDPGMKLLPPEYQRVTYIEGNNSGNTCIDTGWAPGLEFTIKMRASIQTTAQAGTPNTRCYLLGVNELVDGASRESDVVMSTSDAADSQPNSSVRWFNSEGTIKYANIPNKPSLPRVGAPFDLEVISTTTTLTQNLTVGGETTTGSNSGWIGGWAFSRTMYLGALHRTNSTGYYNTNHNVRIFSCQIYDGGTLIRDYLPCRRKSDSKPGLYDLINGAFYPNAGTGEFTLGTDYDEDLPSEYQQVKDIVNIGSAYLNTGVTDKSGLRIVADVKYNQFLQNANTLFGTGGGNPVYRFNAINPSASRRMLVGYDNTGSTQSDSGVILDMNRHTIDVLMSDAERSITIDGELKWSDTTEKTYESKNQQMLLFAYRYNGSPNTSYIARAALYSCQIYDNDNMIRDFVPCRRKSDNRAGLYDRITRQFFTNASSAGFQYGRDVNTITPNLDAPINEDLWANISGTTYRDILEEIAGATGTIAVIGGGDDTLDLKLPPITETSETLTEANLITAKIGEDWGEVSSVVLSRQPQNDNIEVTDQKIVDSAGGKNYMPVESVAITDEQRTKSFRLRMPAGTYTYSFNLDSFELGTNSSISLYSNVPLDNGVMNDYNISGTINSSTTLGRKSYTFTIEDETMITRDANIRIPQTAWDNGGRATISNIMIEKGSTATAYEPYTANGRVDLTIANNEILDKQRETTAQPILDAVKGWEYRNAEIKTEGHGYHEIGDRLDLSVAGETYKTIVTKSAITINGGIQETLTSAMPEIIPIDYAKSGGITKTVFRTELTVDKQAQQIDSIVSRQDATDAAVAEQFTQITQNLTEIVATAQASGGGNLIRNSVGFGKENDGTLTIWQYGTGATTTTVHSQSAPASLSAGAVSGHEIQMTGASTISQNITLTPGETYTLALRAKKNTAGAVTITVGNTTNSETITLAAGTAYDWQRQNVEFTPTMSTNTVTITVPSGASVELTDLMLATGGAMTWRQASGEIYNAQVSLDQAGVQVRSSVYTGDYVEITPLEFAGYSNASGTMKKVFSLNRETTEVEQLEARSEIKMPPIKIVPINNSSYKGWAFVKEE